MQYFVETPPPPPTFKEKIVRFFKPRRIVTPTVLQMEAVECGAAAMAIVMEYYGAIVPLEQIRIACGVSRNGSKASNMLKAARDFGFKANGYKRTVQKVKDGTLPAIVFWNFNHFLVVEGFYKDKVYLNDPSTGPRVVSFEEFDSSFTGVTLILEPGEGFKKGGQKPSLLQNLAKRLKGSSEALIYILLASLLLTFLGVIVPSYTRIFIDQFLVNHIDVWVLPLLAAMLITIPVIYGLSWLQQHHLLRLETKLAISTSGQYFWHILRLPIDFFNQRYTADISIRVAINDDIARLLSGELATNFLNILLIIIYFYLMIQYNVLLTLIGVGIAGINIVALRYFSRRRKDANLRLLSEQGKLTSTAYGGLQIIETFKATGRESDFFSRWAGYQAKAINAEQDLNIPSELLAALPTVLTAVNIALILTVGGKQIIDGKLSMGELIAFQGLMTAFLLPVNQIVDLGTRLQKVQGDITRLDDVLRYPVQTMGGEVNDNPAFALDTKLSGQLKLNNITFGYSPLEPPLIENFNLNLKPGARVALVGGSGSGKSTIARLVAGVYEPWSGEILFDGMTREQIPSSRLHNSLAMVDQDIYLFEGSVRQNITMWDTTVPEASLIQAAKDAVIHDDISQRPGGYDHHVGESGANFSGGQRQRLEIARALSHDPTILVMDEATSALDPITEKSIDENLRRRGCTCLIVAHRLSTIRDCDEIIVLEKGKVVQRGTHNEMSRRAGPYANLIKTDDGLDTQSTSLLDLFVDSV